MTNTQKKLTGIAAAILVLGILGIAYLRARYVAIVKAQHELSWRNICRNNLRMIDDVKEQAALTLNYKAGDTLTEQDISSYLRGGFSGLACPKGGHYTINPVGKESECSEHGSISTAKVTLLPKPGAELKKAADARAAAMQLEAEREGMRLDNVMAVQAAQASQAKLAAEAEAARLEKERQAKVAAAAEAAEAVAAPNPPPVAPVAVPTPTAQYKLNAIMGKKGNYQALINNQIFKVGDKFDTGKILTIEATQVTIQATDGTMATLRMDADGTGRTTPGDATLPPALRKGLLAYYPFNRDEGDHVSDNSDCRRNATAENVIWTPDGKVGGAVCFSPEGSRIIASDQGLPAGDAPRSIAFWKKTGPKNEIVTCLLTYGAQHRNQECSLGMDWRDGRSSIQVSPNGTCNVAGTKIANERWYHVVYCYGGNGEHTFFINGVAEAPSVREFREFDTQLSGKLFLGDSDDTPPSYDGWMDEVMIYDRVLSPAEIRQIYER